MGYEALNVLKQGLSRIGQIAGFGRPIIHLQIDVVVIVGIPRWPDLFIPLSLQVGGKFAGCRAGDQQVASVIEVEQRQTWVWSTFAHCLQPFVRRQI